MDQETNEVVVKPLDKSKVRTFLIVTLILFVVTLIEYGFAFGIPHEYKMVRIVLFISLTIVKAYYIVSEFMHLGHENKPFKRAIIFPAAFVLFFIFIMMYQGGAVFDLLFAR